VAPIDTLIVARGGGSIEDLWAFNDERVANAVAASAIPTIAGVGHETDFTIVDFVADLRAPTPSAAAAAAVPARDEVRGQIAASRQMLLQRATQHLRHARRSLAQSVARLQRIHPQRQLDQQRQRLDERGRRLHLAVDRALLQRRDRRLAVAQRLEALNPRRVLGRGYSIVQREDGAVVTTPELVVAGERLTVRAAGGEYAVNVA
jgi:exodeoxyribonuclease VII large subunit